MEITVVNRLYQLQKIRNKLEYDRENFINTTTNTTTTTTLEEENNTTPSKIIKNINNAIIDVSNWQDTMIGFCLWVDRTQRSKDRQLISDFSGKFGKFKNGYGNMDEGLHWVFHQGELYDYNHLLHYLPIWTSVSKESKRYRRKMGCDNASGSVKDMVGTPFVGDSYTCALVSILIHGLPQPNKKRTVINTIINSIKSF